MDNESLLDCWTMFSRENGNISVDRMLCDPELRQKFVLLVAGIEPTATEAEVLWQLMGLRKRKKLSKKMR